MNHKITDHTIFVTVVNTVSAAPNHFGIEGRKDQRSNQMVQK